MPECPCLDGCPFFNGKMKNTEGVAVMYKKRYCRGEHTKCARYMVRVNLGAERVPADLYPNMHERAEDLIGKPACRT